MKSIIATYLLNDATLAALLTGGLYYDKIEINRQLTPNAFDSNNFVKPCALLKGDDLRNAEIFNNAPVMQGFTLYIYTSPQSSSTAESIVNRVTQLLRSTYINNIYFSNISNVISDMDDPSIKSRLDIVNFTILRSL